MFVTAVIVQALAQSQTCPAIVTTQDLHLDGSSQQESVEVDTAFDGTSVAADESATVQFPREVSASNSDDLQQSPAPQSTTGFTVLEPLESESSLISVAGEGVLLLGGALQLPLAQHPLTAFAALGPLEALESESALTSIAGEGVFLLGGALQLPLEQHPEAGSFLTLLDWSEYKKGSALFKKLSLRISWQCCFGVEFVFSQHPAETEANGPLAEEQSEPFFRIASSTTREARSLQLPFEQHRAPASAIRDLCKSSAS